MKDSFYWEGCDIDCDCPVGICRYDAAVTPSCGCVFCDIGLKPTKMKRQYVHYHRRGDPKRTGAWRIIVCGNSAYNYRPSTE